MPAWNIQIVCARHEHDHTLAYLIIRKKQLKIVLMEELDAAIEYLQYALVRLLVPDSSCYQDMLPMKQDLPCHWFSLWPAIFSISELGSAMPRSGGPYYFINLSFGPLLGIIGALTNCFGINAALIKT